MISASGQSLFRTPLDSGYALPLAGALGGLVGGSMAAVFQGIGNCLPGAGLGALLGTGFCGVQREMQATHARIHEYRAIAEYPAVRALLRKAGTDERDLAALHCLSDKLEETFGKMTARFKEYCAKQNVEPSPLMDDLIRHFYLTHCADRGVVLLSRRGMRPCYLVAAHHAQQDRFADALNTAHVSAEAALRRLRCPYLPVDMVNEQLAHARSFTTEERNGEWTVHAVTHRPGETLETVQPSSLVEAVRRRCTRRNGVEEPGPDRAALPDTTALESSVKVERGPRLRATLVGLKRGSRTLRELDRIEQDLAAHRSCGHPVSYQGRAYLAIDIHWEGRRSPGRNAWRLLYFRTPAGYTMHDIVDYHRP